MCAIVKFSKNHAFQSLRHRYKNVNHTEQLRRIKQYVNAQDTKLQKLQQIEEFVYAEFARTSESFLPIHDLDIRRFAIKKARSLNLNGFKASHHWLSDFKHRHHISSRKITKFVTKHYIEDPDKIFKSVENFVSKVKDRLSNYAADHILNSDQSSFNYGNPSTRTLARAGEKITMRWVKSMNAVTHSYTIMLIINMLGELVGPVFICLQEPKGRLGPRIQKSIYEAKNIHVTCSKSGKLTKSHIQYWVEKVLRPSVSDNCLLLLDSWSGQTDPHIYNEIFTGNIKCEQLQIPPKTTGDIQPLDRYFFRQWKYFKQSICDRVAIDEIEIDITARNNILKMHSLILNQLTARKFSSMIKCSWYSSGYLLNDPGPFENVQD
ncbi:unnamed protein product, partial [Rotaria sp. Silwood2]